MKSKCQNIKVGGSIKEYEEAIKEITLHKKRKIKFSTLEEMLSEIWYFYYFSLCF